jgi:hypothetical protein
MPPVSDNFERSQQKLSEFEIFRISLEIAGDDGTASSALARAKVLRWAKEKSGVTLPPEAWRSEPFEVFSGGRNCAAVRIQRNEIDFWALRSEKPDTETAGRIWSTEVAIGSVGSKSPKLSVRLIVNTSEQNLDVEPAVQTFVSEIARESGLRSRTHVMRSDYMNINGGNFDAFMDFLLDSDRIIPIIAITKAAHNDAPALSPILISKSLAGLAQVVLLESDACWSLTESIGKVRSVFGGAVRVYMPDFSEHCDPYLHRLELAEHLKSIDGPKSCARWLRKAIARDSIQRHHLGRDILTFSSIRTQYASKLKDDLDQTGANDREQLFAANKVIGDLQAELHEEKKHILYFDAEHKSAEERANFAEYQLRSALSRIQYLEAAIESRSPASNENESEPKDFKSISDWVDKCLVGKLALTSAARKGIRNPEFREFPLILRCLKWLAQQARDRRLNSGEGSLRDTPIEPGVYNSPCGNDSYDVSWQGRNHKADWHIKNNGNTRDPSRCLRIYYFWDDASNQMIITDMPAHRKTGAS